MSFISYAQNYEDVILWRALKHVQNGFYIDVGAAWPDEHSVTKAFYDRGWKGINIDPNPMHHSSLSIERDKDINLKLAVGDVIDQMDIFIIENTGLSTLDKQIADNHQKEGWLVKREIASVSTLASICEEYVCKDQDIHFLKVDAEGFERQVLLGNDWLKYRPWIVLVEATTPMTQVESFADWEMILIDNNYDFVYADGLNRYYLANEHKELNASLKYPPNVFDGFIVADHRKIQIQAHEAEVLAQHYQQQAQEQVKLAQQYQRQAQEQAKLVKFAQERVKEAEAASHRHWDQLQAVYNSKSWRITAPLRWSVHHIHLLREYGFKQMIKTLIKKSLRKAVLSIVARPKLKNFGIKFASKIGILDRLKLFVGRLLAADKSPGSLNQLVANFNSIDLPNLSTRSKQIHKWIQLAIEKHRKVG